MVREDKAVSYKRKTDAADKPGDLAHGKSAIMTSVGKDDAIVSAAEAAYRLSRMTSFGPDAGRWAVAGMRSRLCGQARDAGVGRMLERMQG